MKEKAVVIGGGVSGITTAITLQLLGFETACYSKQLVGEKANGNPCFASQYPAASVIPHSVYTDGLKQFFPSSQAIFEELYSSKVFHVVKHRHFDLSEFETERPAYASDLDNFVSVRDSDDARIPGRADTSEVYGWVFDCFLAEWPLYIHRLYEFYQLNGGNIYRQEIRREDVNALPADLVINCTGMDALELVADPASPQLIRGYLVHVHDRPLIRNKNGLAVSYNYTPELSVYSTAGKNSDVYFYPVNGHWLFGGSRQHGALDEEGNWRGEDYPDSVNIDGLKVPRPVITLNSEILSNSFGITPGFFASNVHAYVGYRFVRKGAGRGLRIEAEETGSKLMVHNYGHGGAGVTLSWGCALKVLQCIEQAGAQIRSDRSYKKEVVQRAMKGRLQEVYARYFT